MARVGALTGKTIGRYHLLELLGEGGVSAVYHAYHPPNNHHAAVKILTLDGDSLEFYDADRFALEARIIASLQHPHILPIYEYGVDGTLSYLAMPLLLGGTLQERLEFRLRQAIFPSLGEVTHLLRQLASALSYAHARGVIHRDVKTTNVMFDERGKAFLVDFGIAKLTQASTSLTRTGMIVGTPAYMAPEQWRSEALSSATDQYALAVILHLMISGHLPFEADTPPELMYKHLQENAPLVTSARPDVPDSVSEVLLRALSKTPEERYPSIHAFSHAFEQAVQGAEGAPTQFFTFSLPIERFTLPLPSSAPPPRPHRALQLPPVFIGVGLGLVAILVCFATLLIGAVTVRGLRSPTLMPSTLTVEVTQAAMITSEPTPEATAVPLTVEFIAPTLTLQPSAAASVTEASAPLANSISSVQPGLTLQTRDSAVRAVAFHPNGQLVASGGNGDVIQMWDGSAGAQQLILIGHSDTIYSLDFSADGSRLVSASADGTVKVWDGSGGALLMTLQGHNGEVRCVRFSPDGQMIVSVGQDQTVRLWDVTSGAPLDVLSIPSDRALSAAFTWDGTALVYSEAGFGIAVWDLASRARRSLLMGHTDEIRAIEFRPGSAQLVTASADATVRLWDLQSDTVQLILEHSRNVFDAAFSPDGSVIATGAADNNLYLWDAASGEQLITLPGHSGWVFDVDFSPDGRWLASAGGDGTVRLWQLDTES